VAVDTAALKTLRGLAAAENDAQVAARTRAKDVTSPPPPEVGAFLSWLAATAEARHVVEVGTAGGVTGLWLLRGMAERGVLTSIESDNAIHGVTTESFEHARVADQVRSIAGDPLEVLPRLSDDGYELCVMHTYHGATPALLQHARRLLKAGGLLVVLGLNEDALHAFVDLVDENDDVMGAALPFGGGVGVATLG
jgi:predicted O-methyltransferase YrrM